MKHSQHYLLFMDLPNVVHDTLCWLLVLMLNFKKDGLTLTCILYVTAGDFSS